MIKLPISKRPFANISLRLAPKKSRFYSSTTRPLRVLFCGSDEFSISSLRALHSLQKATNDASTFASIDVVCRPGKKSGRGMKKIREVPIKGVAEQLQLPLHEIDTFTGWTPPRPQQEEINLIVAVSFGLFVPPRILRGAKYGGINVHPSLLPDFRGPAPLQHTLLAGSKYTGISIQTLSEIGFDQGQILAQTPFPGLEIPNPEHCTFPELLDFVKPLAGEMLSKYVQDTYLKSHDHEKKGNFSSIQPDVKNIRHAPKITTGDREFDWENWTARDIVRRDRILGRLWTKIRHRDETTDQEHEKRVIFEGLQLLPADKDLIKTSVAALDSYRLGGIPLEIYRHEKSLIIVTKPDHQLLKISSVTIEGRNKQDASELCNFGTIIEKKS